MQAKARRRSSRGTAQCGRHLAPRHRRSSGRQHRRPIAARTVPRAGATGVARSLLAPPGQRQRPPLRVPRQPRVLRHHRWRPQPPSHKPVKACPCSFPGIAAPGRRRSVHPRRPLDNRSGRRCGSPRSAHWSAVSPPCSPLSIQPRAMRSQPPERPQSWAPPARIQPSAPLPALPPHAPRFGSQGRGSTCSSAGIAAKLRRQVERWSNAPCNRSGIPI